MSARSAMLAAGLVAASAIQSAAARDAHCAPINQRDVAMFFEQWDQALATGDPKKVVARYAKDAVLLPTLSEMPRKNHAEIADYFVEFLKKHPRGTIDSRTIRIGCNEAFDAGLYTFMVDGPNAGERVPVKARFSFIYEMRGGRWMITHHHSSALPHHADGGFDLQAAIRKASFEKDRCVLHLTDAELEAD
jgi:uncharacterized protein (TIGR02246 family)